MFLCWASSIPGRIAIPDSGVGWRLTRVYVLIPPSRFPWYTQVWILISLDFYELAAPLVEIDFGGGDSTGARRLGWLLLL